MNAMCMSTAEVPCLNSKVMTDDLFFSDVVNNKKKSKIFLHIFSSLHSLCFLLIFFFVC
jgi:hypothetical protein